MLARMKDLPPGITLLPGTDLRMVDLAGIFGADLPRLPQVHRILAENALRRAIPAGTLHATRDHFTAWLSQGGSEAEITFLPGRIMMHDTTCGPALVDIAAMRDVLAEHGCDPARLRPAIPVDVSTDHSSGVDVFARPDAFTRNLEAEFRRNAERYRLMKWAGSTLPGIRVHPPGSGIMHTINLERLAEVVVSGNGWVFPDAMIGTDSHTPMINGLGILGWGVGGLEAEGALFGVPVTLRLPDVVGVKLVGHLRAGITATDLALTVTEALRKLDVTGDFVEFYGPGVVGLAVGARACIANMAPEYGASTGYFPIDSQTLDYLAMLGRKPATLQRIEAYAEAAGLLFDPSAEPVFTRSITLDLSEIKTSLAGPRRPQDRRSACDTRGAFDPPLAVRSSETPPDGAVAIAAITSCTNTSDQRMLVAAGLLAKRAAELGLKPPTWVKTSLAPGSPSAASLLKQAGLMEALEAIGFGIVGYGCTTCIGNSGQLTPEIAVKIGAQDFRPVAVLSGNRNFPGRVHPDLEYGFLASPPLVIAFALAGHVNLDVMKDALGHADGQPVRLADLWPCEAEVDMAMDRGVAHLDVERAYDDAAQNPLWAALDAPEGEQFPWNAASTYLRRPPFVTANRPVSVSSPAHPLLVLGDDVTTDHISPAGAIRPDSATGRYLIAHGENPADLNVHASRRGNFESMLRGAFTNRLVRNALCPEAPAGSTLHAPTGEVVPLPEAAARYREAGNPLVIVAGARYGMGSSRDWAAKAVALLGVRAIIAVSFERIHRTNLIGMGILPLTLPEGVTPEGLTLKPGDTFELDWEAARRVPRQAVEVTLVRATGQRDILSMKAAIETSLEVELLASGGLIPHVLNGLLAEA
jgi:aconitate hydratase